MLDPRDILTVLGWSSPPALVVGWALLLYENFNEYPIAFQIFTYINLFVILFVFMGHFYLWKQSIPLEVSIGSLETIVKANSNAAYFILDPIRISAKKSIVVNVKLRVYGNWGTIDLAPIYGYELSQWKADQKQQDPYTFPILNFPIKIKPGKDKIGHGVFFLHDFEFLTKIPISEENEREQKCSAIYFPINSPLLEIIVKDVKREKEWKWQLENFSISFVFPTSKVIGKKWDSMENPLEKPSGIRLIRRQ